MKKLLTITAILLAFASVNAQTLHLYGGKNHDVYLGCLNCGPHNNKSIWNDYGQHGNSYNKECIWNSYSTYGNQYSDYSPWSSYASYPPVIVDKYGNFYGYFTTNIYKEQRADFKLVNMMYQFHELMADNLDGWYNSIF